MRTEQPWGEVAAYIAVSKGPLIFAHPNECTAAVEYALGLSRKPGYMSAHPGEVMGHLAYAHPFLDGNGRALMVVHSELARRASFAIDWSLTSKSDYLTELTKEIDYPGKGILDAYLLKFKKSFNRSSDMSSLLLSISGLDGSAGAENTVIGAADDPRALAYCERRAHSYASNPDDAGVSREAMIDRIVGHAIRVGALLPENKKSISDSIRIYATDDALREMIVALAEMADVGEFLKNHGVQIPGYN